MPPSRLRNPWTDERHVLQLLETYATSELRTLHLKVIGTDVLLFLRQNCPNIEVFSFWPPTLPRGHALDSKCRPVPHFSKNMANDLTDSLQVPTKRVVKVQLAFMGVEAAAYGVSFVEFECGGFTHALMCRLSSCRLLRHVTLVHCDGITTKGIVTLTEGVPDLQELWLLDFKHRATETDTLSGMLRCIAQNLKQLTSFRFTTARLDVNLDKFFLTVCKNGALKQLWIGRGPYRFNEGAFKLLCLCLPGLEELVLESCDCVTDAVMESIGTHLTKLRLLNLSASGPYTSRGIACLRDHPSLEITNVPGLEIVRDKA